MESEYKINAYEKNQITLYAVQGECESRTVIFNIIEKSGIVISTSNANVNDKMLDLTGYTADLFAIYNQEMIASCQGDITNATKGQVKFTLTADFMSMSGKLTCVIMLKKGSTNLRIVGITLDVQPVMIDPTKENTIKIYKNTAYSTGVQIYDNGEVYILGNTESLIFTLKNGDTDILQKTLTSADYDTLAARVPQAEAIAQAGDWMDRGQEYYYQLLLHEWMNSALYGMPVIACPGNHEYTKSIPKELSSVWHKAFTVPLNGPATVPGVSYYVDFPHLRFIVLDTNPLDDAPSRAVSRQRTFQPAHLCCVPSHLRRGRPCHCRT